MIAAILLAAAATPSEPVRCALNYATPAPCVMTDEVGADGGHRLTFATGGRRIVFEGHAQTGWWSGRLDGAPAMGYERNRGNVVFSTADLRTTFAWWYPKDAHGRY